MGKLFDAWELGMHGCETNSCAGLDSVVSEQSQPDRAVLERCATGCDHSALMFVRPLSFAATWHSKLPSLDQGLSAGFIPQVYADCERHL